MNAQDDRQVGKTAIHEAVEAGNLEIVKILLDAGADPKVRGWMRLNALDAACRRGDALGNWLLAAAARLPE